MSNKRILMVADSFRGGGKERRIIELIRGLKENGYIIFLVILKPLNQYPQVNELGIEILWLNRKLKKDPAVFLLFFKICRQFKPDIIHSWGSMSSVYTLPAAKIFRIKFVNAMVANGYCKRFSSFWWRARLTFPFSDIIMGNSHAGIRAFKAPKSRSRVIYNGFRFSRIDSLVPSTSIKKKFKITTDYVVGMVGMVDYRKDFETFIKAAREVIKNRNDITFLAVGDGIYLDRFLKETENDDKIIFTGRQTDVESIVNIFDIAILTTNRERHEEGISNAILEYMALKKPVIATEGGGTNEIIIHTETGYLIPHAASTQLADLIRKLIENPELRFSMGQRAEKHIQINFSLKKMVDSVIQMYSDILA